MGGTFTSCAEANVLGYPGTRYFGEHILLHEFSHNIHWSMRRVYKDHRIPMDVYHGKAQRP